MARDIHERKALYEAINRHRPGEIVRLQIMRNNQVQNLEISANHHRRLPRLIERRQLRTAREVKI